MLSASHDGKTLAVIDGEGVLRPISVAEPRPEFPRVWKVPELMETPEEIGYTEDGVTIIPGQPKTFVDYKILEDAGVRYDRISGAEDDPKVRELAKETVSASAPAPLLLTPACRFSQLEEIKVRDSYKNFDVVELDCAKVGEEKVRSVKERKTRVGQEEGTA
jgi:hypothetical protein